MWATTTAFLERFATGRRFVTLLPGDGVAFGAEAAGRGSFIWREPEEGLSDG